MRTLAALLLVAGFSALAQDRPSGIDANTKIQGGADVRGSGAGAGSGNKIEGEPRLPERTGDDANPARPDKTDEPKADHPTSERKPHDERKPEDAARGKPAN